MYFDSPIDDRRLIGIWDGMGLGMNGGDPFSLQRILGHTNQETTSKYVNMARTNVKSQHSKYSPGERLG